MKTHTMDQSDESLEQCVQSSSSRDAPGNGCVKSSLIDLTVAQSHISVISSTVSNGSLARDTLDIIPASVTISRVSKPSAEHTDIQRRPVDEAKSAVEKLEVSSPRVTGSPLTPSTKHTISANIQSAGGAGTNSCTAPSKAPHVNKTSGAANALSRSVTSSQTPHTPSPHGVSRPGAGCVPAAANSIHQQQQSTNTNIGGHHQPLSVSTITTLHQYGITTSNMSTEQLLALQQCCKAQHHSYIVEAPSLVVPYLSERVASTSFQQMLSQCRDTSGQHTEVTEMTSEEPSTDEVKDNLLPSADHEDFSHLGKWSFFYQSSVGRFIFDQGKSLVEEFIKEDLLRQQKRKAQRRPDDSNAVFAVRSLTANLASSRARNAPFHAATTLQCAHCHFRTDSDFSLQHHLEVPHVKNMQIVCNWCSHSTRQMPAMIEHVQQDHPGTPVRFERAYGSLHNNYYALLAQQQQCPLCPYEDSSRARLTRHLAACIRRFKPERNMALSDDEWTPPAVYMSSKAFSMSQLMLASSYRGGAAGGSSTGASGANFSSGFRAAGAVSGLPVAARRPEMDIIRAGMSAMAAGGGVAFGTQNNQSNIRRGRPVGTYKDLVGAKASVNYKQGNTTKSVVQATHYQIGNQLYQLINNQLVPVNQTTTGVSSKPASHSGVSGASTAVASLAASLPPGISIHATPCTSATATSSVSAAAADSSDPSTNTLLNSSLKTASSSHAASNALKFQSSPSISITPVPPRPSLPPSVPSMLRTGTTPPGVSISRLNSSADTAEISPLTSQPVATGPAGTGTSMFVICEICDGYIKDLEQLRSHMQWIHKVRIHPKMIQSRPPLNCQKCQLRFFTDQGLERHLLGSHGLVTSSMQQAAARGQDSGRCPVCGRVFQYKLLHHVSRDHRLILKPAHLSYKCTVCAQTFSMYKQFEAHVYSAHSIVAKRIMESSGTGSRQTHSDLTEGGAVRASQLPLNAPIKISDEITIIAQRHSSSSGGAQEVPQRDVTGVGGPTDRGSVSAVCDSLQCQLCDFSTSARAQTGAQPARAHSSTRMCRALERHYREEHAHELSARVHFEPLDAQRAALGDKLYEQVLAEKNEYISRRQVAPVGDDDGVVDAEQTGRRKRAMAVPMCVRKRRRRFVGPRSAIEAKRLAARVCDK